MYLRFFSVIYSNIPTENFIANIFVFKFDGNPYLSFESLYSYIITNTITNLKVLQSLVCSIGKSLN